MAKNLITTNILGSVKAPLTKAALDTLQANFKEIPASIARGVLGSYTTGNVIIWEGFIITLSTVTTTNDTATWTAGTVYYNGEFYQVTAGTLTKTSGVFLYSIIDSLITAQFSDGNSYNWLETKTITITSGTSGTGIADYAAATVKSLVSLWKSSSSTAGATVTSSAGVVTISALNTKWIKKGNVCILNYQIGLNFDSSVTKDFTITFPIPIPSIPTAFNFAVTSLAGVNFGGSVSPSSFIAETLLNGTLNVMNIVFQQGTLNANIGATYSYAEVCGQYSYEIAY